MKISKELDWFFNHLSNNIPFAFARFNDGEVGGIMYENFVAARGDQLINNELKQKLIECITHKQQNYYIGIPCKECMPEMYSVSNKIIGEYQYKKRAVILTNRNWKTFIDHSSEAFKYKNILWVSGDDQNTNNLPFKVTDQILIPRVDSWKFYDQLKNYWKQIPENWVVLISLGPTARILTKEWFENRPDLTIIDIGSNFDPFTRNVRHKCHIGWENGFNIQTRCKGCN